MIIGSNEDGASEEANGDTAVDSENGPVYGTKGSIIRSTTVSAGATAVTVYSYFMFLL